MNSKTDLHPREASAKSGDVGILPRKVWRTPQVILGEVEDTETQNGGTTDGTAQS
jgi:hypothetical protein